MSPIANNDSSDSISPYPTVLNFDVLWHMLEYIMVTVFTADDPMPWAQAAGGLMLVNQGLIDRGLLPLQKLHRAIYWEHDALWIRYKAGDEAASSRRAYLGDRDCAILRVLDIMGAGQDWAFLHAADRTLTGFSFHVAKYIVEPAINENS